MTRAARSLTAREATGFVRADMLFLVPVVRWSKWDREIWRCGASRSPAGRATPLPERWIVTYNPAPPPDLRQWEGAK